MSSRSALAILPAVICGLCLLPSGVLAAASGPGQPATGPGGSDYAHASVTRFGPYWSYARFLNPSYRYFIYEPADPTPASAPVVLFLHGWLAYKPEGYEEWIKHIVRKGHSVVWAQYDQLDPFPTFADKAAQTWDHALRRMRNRPWENHVPPEKNGSGDARTAIVGHSTGGYLAAILAARAADTWSRFPKPEAIVAVEPGAWGWVPSEDMGAIDPATRMLIVVGNDDDIVCTLTARKIWERTPQIPDGNRDMLLVPSDDHGVPAQNANHYFPNSSGVRDTAAVDGRDFYVTYKLSVAALNCVFRGADCNIAFGDGSLEQLDMGQWSDGVLVEPMVWIENPLTDLDPDCTEPQPGPNKK